MAQGIRTDTSATGLFSLVLSDTMLDGVVDRVLRVDAAMNCLALNTDPSPVSAAARQGVVSITGTRSSDFPFVTWDGNPDTGLKMTITNAAANTTARGAVRGIDVNARNKGSSANCSFINAIYATAENANNTIVDMYTGQFNMKNSGVATNNYGLVIQDQSQGTSTNAYALRITTGTINPASGARAAAINLATKDTAGFTHALFFESGTGLEGGYETGTTSGGEAGYIKVKIGSTTLRIKTFGDS